MQVTVSLKIHLDATASLSEMERQIRAAGQEAMKQALEQAIHQSEEQQKRCPTCGSDQLPELRTHISRHDPGRRKCDGSNRNAHKRFSSEKVLLRSVQGELSSLSQWLEFDLIAHPFESSDELLLHHLSIPLIEIIAP